MTSPQPVDHLIIGAGFSGLCTAIKLQEDGEGDFVVIEQGPDVGGTWRDNTYPGAACDVPSQLYSYSFAPNPTWSRSYSPQPEILDYLRGVAQRSGTLERFRFDTVLEHATWDETTSRWEVRTSGGDYSARTLISCAGVLVEPKLPEIDGLDDFGGEIFHTARWDHGVDLTGKRVAIIGTGASAIQIIPQLAKTVGHLDVYQRTAPWVIPRHDRRYSGLEQRALRRVPGLQRAYRAAVFVKNELTAPAFTWQPRIFAIAQRGAIAHMARSIKDPELRRKVTPSYTMGCKRVLISSDYYPALASDHVDLVSDPIAKITGDAVVTKDGVERPVDVVVVATGFEATDQPIAHHLTGADGRTLAEVWSETGMRAYRGSTVPGFPNLFMVFGPNTALGHSSVVLMIESHVAYVRSALATMRRDGLTRVEVDEDKTVAWNTRLHNRMRHTVWSKGGCSSYYQDDQGRITTLWPRSTISFRLSTRRFDADAYTTSTDREVVPA